VSRIPGASFPPRSLVRGSWVPRAGSLTSSCVSLLPRCGSVNDEPPLATRVTTANRCLAPTRPNHRKALRSSRTTFWSSPVQVSSTQRTAREWQRRFFADRNKLFKWFTINITHQHVSNREPTDYQLTDGRTGG
jgi:hypothetical protein